LAVVEFASFDDDAEKGVVDAGVDVGVDADAGVDVASAIVVVEDSVAT